MVAIQTSGGQSSTSAYVSSSVSAQDNDEGLSVKLDCSGRNNKGAVVYLGGTATATIEVSVDEQDWHVVQTIISTGELTSFSTDEVMDLMRAFSHIRVKSLTTGVDLKFTISAT